MLKPSKLELILAKKSVIFPHSEINERAGFLDKKARQQLFTGALITDYSGNNWVHPTQKKSPCSELKKGQEIEKLADSPGCDTGNWGKCVFGGLSLRSKSEVGSQKSEVFFLII